MSGGGVIAGATQTSIGDGSDSSWDVAKCEIVVGFTKWKWRREDTFHLDEPSGADANVSIMLSCEILKTSKIAYTTKNYLCVGDTVKVDNEDCSITSITTEFDS